jgi:flagellar biosynthesis protein FlhB
MSSKSEEPTPRRLRRAHEEGDSGQSAYAAQALVLVVAVALLPSALRALVSRVTDDMRAAIAHAADPSPVVTVDPGALGVEVAALALPVLLAAGLVGAFAYVAQTGGVVPAKRLAPDFGRLDPLRGLLAIFSTARLFAVARAFFGAALVAFIAYRALAFYLGDLARVSGRVAEASAAAAEIAYGVAKDAALLGLVLAVIDVVVVRRAWRKRLMMTPAEVKKDRRESEGDPETKATRERARRDMIAAASAGDVRGASVVIADGAEVRIAVALLYDEAGGDAAPIVLAGGEGDLAAPIAEGAKGYGVPVVRDRSLAIALAKLRVGDAIPESLYDAVADILRDL